MRRILASMLGLVFLSLAVFGSAGCGGGGDEVAAPAMTMDQWFAAVHVGMTRDQIAAAVGKDADTCFARDWFWRYGEQAGIVEFNSGGVAIRVTWSPDYFK